MSPGTTPSPEEISSPNTTSSSTNVTQARAALGRRLRELRTGAQLSGRQLAESLSWPPSKVSKLENARQTPTDEDILGWTRVTDRAAETDNLLAALHTLEEQHAEWRRVLLTGHLRKQTSILEDEQKTRRFRVFQPMTIPGLLQTADYARARFTEGVRLHDVPDEIDAAVQTRLRRQEIIYRADKRFHFVLTEAALRYRLCPPAAMLAQLDRLIPLGALPTVRLGIIGFDTVYDIGPWHGFWLHDADRVTVETYTAELNLAQPQEIAIYARVFESLAGIASYGRAARAIITRVVDDLAAEVPEEDQ